MKRVSRSTAAKTLPGNPKDVLQAIPSDASLAPALPASRCASRSGHPRAGCGKRGAELADLRRSHIRIAGQPCACEALLLAFPRRADARVDCLRRFATGGICKLVVGHAGDVLLSYV